MPLSGISTDELTLFREEVWGVLKWAEAKESATGVRDLGRADSHTFCVAIGEFDVHGRSQSGWLFAERYGGGQWVIVGGGGGQVVRLCCGGGWQLWGVCRNAELVIVGIYGRG